MWRRGIQAPGLKAPPGGAGQRSFGVEKGINGGGFLVSVPDFCSQRQEMSLHQPPDTGDGFLLGITKGDDRFPEVPGAG